MSDRDVCIPVETTIVNAYTLYLKVLLLIATSTLD